MRMVLSIDRSTAHRQLQKLQFCGKFPNSSIIVPFLPFLSFGHIALLLLIVNLKSIVSNVQVTFFQPYHTIVDGFYFEIYPGDDVILVKPPINSLPNDKRACKGIWLRVDDMMNVLYQHSKLQLG